MWISKETQGKTSTSIGIYVFKSFYHRWLATTHFQSVYARRVFPCFDEPYFKSTFEISIAHRTNMTALSNMPLREMEPK